MQPKLPRNGSRDISVAQRASLPSLTLLLSVAVAWTRAVPTAVLLQQARPSSSLRVKTPAALEVAWGQPGGEKIPVSGCKVPWLGTALPGASPQPGERDRLGHFVK